MAFLEIKNLKKQRTKKRDWHTGTNSKICSFVLLSNYNAECVQHRLKADNYHSEKSKLHISPAESRQLPLGELETTYTTG